MAEKIYPAAKPAAGPPPATTTANPTFPATKAQLYNNSRPVYRPQPRRSRRSCCCCFCLWITFAIIVLIVIAAVAGGVMYVLYRPHRPTFSVSALHVTQFNLTSANKLNSRFNFTVTARNPNKKIVFYYDPVSVSFDSNGVNVGDGTIPAFEMKKKNTTSLRTIVTASGQSVDDNNLKSDLKNKKSVPLKIRLDTKVKAKIGSFKTKRLPIRVTCDGIKAVAPAGKTPTTATTSGAKCKVDLRIKIWKWTV
ncbi:putative Late embryogenesis abundant protein [Helianthus annuus]|uniref:Late embryogenesis abundant protein, LEA_2 subgroup n=1 Tax=Helianthus annuus TaxID=4232 RepID=A0A251U0K8_HELAN|nr:NDR1/HIN1-like protein 13 [Helianthus annuus]KAF5793392.1 putative Late embryogenesis abundant protein, LEA_2 subgroup [Helianthus annuus]KAJ0528231.1 putative Late embryogenesis abundant protein [Helianthus annuus]KAJ0537131.1 putative Late embryogenesis abundant protein [Helianthus annuus]KAJ0544662.1 putative Late embryogenesis abundant protein [Helianthus annuus]KAJ0709663.1 putative Late embryogenesis abundant protein [Helianthus annuus]